jgi:hypothetical protein
VHNGDWQIRPMGNGTDPRRAAQRIGSLKIDNLVKSQNSRISISSPIEIISFLQMNFVHLVAKYFFYQ